MKMEIDNVDIQSCESYLTKLEYRGAGQMTSLHSSLRRRHGLEKDDLAHHRIALRYPRFIDNYPRT